MVKENSGIFGEEQSSATLRENLSRYIAKWPLFLICIVLSVSAGIFYTRYTVPKYIATSSFLIKGAEGGGPVSNDLIESSLQGKRVVNLNNEMLLISSGSLMERTVAKNNFNVSYFAKGRILNIDIYNDAPFTLLVKQLTDSNGTYDIQIKKIDANGGAFVYGPEKKEKSYSFIWDQPFTIGVQSFILSPKRPIKTENVEYIVRWKPVWAAAAELSGNLSVKSIDTKTSVLQLSIKVENLQKGKDVLNALFVEFNLSDVEERNKLSESTFQFIGDRLQTISGELTSVEGNLENYQGSNRLFDIKSQSTQSLTNADEASKTIKELSLQKGVASMISEYFANPTNNGKLVPSSLGLNDATLATLIAQYNDLQLKKEREAPSLAPNSNIMVDLNTQLGNIKSSILESLSNLSKNLQIQQRSYERQNTQYRGFLSAIPHNERIMQEIRRKQSITEGLYLYLLQKREEAAISSTASNVAHYKQIDPASGYGPVEPNSRNIIIYTGLLGFFVAFGWIYLRNYLNDKVVTTEDIVKRTSLPFLGQIAHTSRRRKKQLISVLERNVVGEQFRVIRTNLSYLLKDKSQKIILVTSSLSNEGKSFVSLNLASICAMPGKKVALLEFDIRNPLLNDALHLNNKGLTDYLTGEVNSLSEIMYALEEIPSLHIFPSGAVPLNPADLLLTENMSKLFEALSGYDYIIIDSPPSSMFSDAFILAEYADIVLFVIRSRVTLKKQLDYINDIANNNKFRKTAILLNDVKVSGTQSYYNYGYGPKRDKKRLIGT